MTQQSHAIVVRVRDLIHCRLASQFRGRPTPGRPALRRHDPASRRGATRLAASPQPVVPRRTDHYSRVTDLHRKRSVIAHVRLGQHSPACSSHGPLGVSVLWERSWARAGLFLAATSRQDQGRGSLFTSFRPDSRRRRLLSLPKTLSRRSMALESSKLPDGWSIS